MSIDIMYINAIMRFTVCSEWEPKRKQHELGFKNEVAILRSDFVRASLTFSRGVWAMKENLKKILKEFSVELSLYAVLIGAYIFLVLHYMGGFLAQLFHDDLKLYAALSLALIIGQGFILEMVVRGLLGLVKGKKEK